MTHIGGCQEASQLEGRCEASYTPGIAQPLDWIVQGKLQEIDVIVK